MNSDNSPPFIVSMSGGYVGAVLYLWVYICPSLRYKNSAWRGEFYFLQVFDHALYRHPISLSKDTRIELTEKRTTGVVAGTGHRNIDKESAHARMSLRGRV